MFFVVFCRYCVVQHQRCQTGPLFGVMNHWCTFDANVKFRIRSGSLYWCSYCRFCADQGRLVGYVAAARNW